MNKTVKKSQKGFTLIELLIVIGLLGALTSLILPSLSANREDAIGDVCDYNQAGTVRILRQFNQMFGHFPADMHNGMQGAVTASYAMNGLPSAQAAHMGDASAACPSIHLLTDYQANSLREAGITSVCSGTGLSSTAIPETETPAGTATTVAVVRAYNNTDSHYWYDDSGTNSVMTFDGLTLEEWETGTATPSWDTEEGAGVIVVLWITPTTDWSGDAENANNDWTKGAVELSLDIAGQCPVPAEATDGGDPEFAYYMAYFKVYNNGAAARMIGTTCPECGVMNP